MKTRTFRYHRHGKPIPNGWVFRRTLLAPHGHYSCLIERATLWRRVWAWMRGVA